MASDTFYNNTIDKLFVNKNFNTEIFYNIFLVFGSALCQSKTAHYSREYIESCYSKDLKLMLKSGNKHILREIDHIWKYLLSNLLITKHPTSRSITYCFSSLGLKMFYEFFPELLIIK